MKFRIVPAHTGDASELTALTKQSKGHWGYGQQQIELWADDLTITTDQITEHVTFKSIEKDRITGYYMLVKISAAVVHLDNLFVTPSQIGSGLGTALINHAKEESRARGYLKMTLDSDPHVVSFYLKHQFSITGERPSTIEGRFLPIMECQL